MPSIREALDVGETNSISPAFRAAKIGSRLHAGGVRLFRETVAVAAAAATPSHTVLQLLYAKTIGTGAAGIKSAGINGAAPGVGAAAPNAGGTSVTFNAETTGAGTVDLVYLTADPPKDAIGLDASMGGVIG